MKARLEFKLQDLWVGVFWKRTITRQVCHCGEYMDNHRFESSHGAVEMTQPDFLDVWICLIPCLPVHLMMEVKPQ